MYMKRETLDNIFSGGAIAIAILLILLGFVFKGNADFADSYVSDQLSEQKITFTPAEFLTDDEKKSTCVVEYAGTALDSGKKAECYANDYIAFHVRNIAGGETYATLGAVQRAATKAVADAALTMLDVDAQGLDVMDRKLLLTVIEKFAGGPVGVDNLATAIGEERDTIEDVIEPFLIQQGYLQRTSRGRMATANAYAHFGLVQPRNALNKELWDQAEGAE